MSKQDAKSLKVLVLAGGPDGEREVSLMGGKQVAAALTKAGHDVRFADITPEDLTSLDDFADWQGDAVFPVLHGPWGEGGPLQRLLDDRELRYVGSAGPCAALCIDKQMTKLAMQNAGIPTPEFQLLDIGDDLQIGLPVVVKPVCDGSSIDLHLCRDQQTYDHALAQVHHRHSRVLVERLVDGMEVTVGVITSGPASPSTYIALPPIRIVPATEFYDYEAKYFRDDTRYDVGADAIDLPAEVLDSIGQMALRTHHVLGCRHLSRVDFIIDSNHQPWILEVNTLPGFTSHSLLPMAAAHAGLSLPQLADRLVRVATGQ